MQDVEEFIWSLPAQEKKVLRHLRSLILNLDPRLQEKLSYGVPYYFHHRRICFLWPNSAQPCYMNLKEPPEEKITLGLCYGNLLSNVQGLLVRENRKQVYTLAFTSIQEINDSVIREIIQEAILVDDEFGKKRKKR